MGTEFRITISTTDTTGLQSTIDSAFNHIDALEQMMSDYRADSELNKLAGATHWQVVSTDLYKVLQFCRTLAQRSGGAFDPTIGPLSKLWRRAFRQQEFPQKERVLAARSRVQWKHLRISKRRQTVRLRRPNIRLDLGGVAKGYTLDVVGEILHRAGFPSFIVDGGGDLLIGDAPGKEEWSVKFLGAYYVSGLENTAVATSGDTYRFLERHGTRYSHLIDPRTGYGTTHRRQVTVFGPSAMVADGLASAISINEGEWKKHYPEYEVSILK